MSQLALLDLEVPEVGVDDELWHDPAAGVQWSSSAHSTVRQCQLQYFFGYMMASAVSHDPHRREAWVLR